MNERRVGIIGIGSRGRMPAKNMSEQYQTTGMRVAAVHDVNPHAMAAAAASITEQFAANGATEAAVRTCETGQELLDQDDLDVIMVTTTSDCHAEFVVPALQTSKKVYCDKPLAHTVSDCLRIVETSTAAQKPVMMGFTRRYEEPWRRARQLLADGVIGDVQMILIRDVIPYSRYLAGWWRKREWSGGPLNDKGSHLFDVMNWFIGAHPSVAHAFGTRSIVPNVDNPPTNCRLCTLDCDYRQAPHNPDAFDPEIELPKNQRDACVRSGLSDAYHGGSVHFRYPGDVIAPYVYDYIGFGGADGETMELIGRTGKIILCRHTGSLEVVTDFGRRRETIDCKLDGFGGTHFGADAVLIHDLRDFCNGKAPAVSAPDGLAATRMVAAALESMDAGGRTIPMA